MTIQKYEEHSQQELVVPVVVNFLNNHQKVLASQYLQLIRDVIIHLNKKRYIMKPKLMV